MYRYNLEVWEEVLKSIGFKFIDESCGWNSDVNKLLFRMEKAFPAFDEVSLSFNRKTHEITYIRITYCYRNESEMGNINEFINENIDIFRNFTIKKLVL